MSLKAWRLIALLLGACDTSLDENSDATVRDRGVRDAANFSDAAARDAGSPRDASSTEAASDGGAR